MNKTEKIERGQIYLAVLDGYGSEQRGKRPVVIVQNDSGNRFSSTTLVAPVTSVKKKTNLPVHVLVTNKYLHKNSMILMEQIKVIDKKRLRKYIGRLSNADVERVNAALSVSLALEKNGGNKDE